MNGAKTRIRVALRGALGLLLAGAGVAKLGSPMVFADAIAGFMLLPAVVVGWVAVILPWLEIIAGLMLILNLWTRSAALIAGALFATFTAVIGVGASRGLDVNCGCFGGISAWMPLWVHLAINAGSLAAALVVARVSHERPLNVH